MANEQYISALQELRKKSEKRKFDQTADLIINLKDFNPKTESANVSLTLPHPIKKRKICAFLEVPNPSFDRVITKKELENFEPKELKKIIKEYDVCVSVAKLMPEIAKRFGRILGPAGKMPDPKAGCVVLTEDASALSRLTEQLKKMTHIKSKEASIKVAVGKESMKDEALAENAAAVYNAVLNALPRKKENLKNVLLKFTMSKPVRIKFEK